MFSIVTSLLSIVTLFLSIIASMLSHVHHHIAPSLEPPYLTDIYGQSQGDIQHPRESADISVKPRAHPCYNINVTLSIVVYSIACN